MLHINSDEHLFAEGHFGKYLCAIATYQGIIIQNAILLDATLMSVIIAGCYNTEQGSAKCHSAECYSAEGHSDQCYSDESHSAEYHYI